MGDIRSRLIRLIPPAPSGSPLDCIRRLLEYRLPGGANTSNVAVKQEWGDIVEGTHRLWRVSRSSPSAGNAAAPEPALLHGRLHLNHPLTRCNYCQGIPGDRKETIRAFLVHFQNAVLKKAQRVSGYEIGFLDLLLAPRATA